MRLISIDVLRTLAIVLMVVVHFLENLSGELWGFTGLGAPLFGFLVGVSYRQWLKGLYEKGTSDEAITKVTLRRGLFIFVLGIVFNIVVWLPGDTFNWDVLTLIGTAFVVLAFLRDVPSFIPLLLSLLVFVFSPILRIESGNNEYWLQGYFDPDWSFDQLMLGYLVNGYFPVFPWLIFPLVGFVVSAYIVPSVTKDRPTILWNITALRTTALIGVGFLIALVILRQCRQEATSSPIAAMFAGWTMFPPSIEYVVGVLGVLLTVFPVALWWIDAKQYLRRFPKFVGVCRTMSQYSLSIYVLHHIMHIWPLWLYGICNQQETIHYWRQAMPWPVALALVPPCLVAMYFIFRWVERGKRLSIESLMRRMCG